MLRPRVAQQLQNAKSSNIRREGRVRVQCTRKCTPVQYFCGSRGADSLMKVIETAKNSFNWSPRWPRDSDLDQFYHAALQIFWLQLASVNYLYMRARQRSEHTYVTYSIKLFNHFYSVSCKVSDSINKLGLQNSLNKTRVRNLSRVQNITHVHSRLITSGPIRIHSKYFKGAAYSLVKAFC